MATTEELLAQVQELAKELQDLQDIKAIERVKYEYWDALDHKDFDRLRTVFADDVHYDTSSVIEGLVVDDADTLIEGMIPFMGDENRRSCHQAQQHWIEIDDETTAHGAWSFRDNYYNITTNSEFAGRGYYEDVYRKVDGRWVIASTIITYNMADAKYDKKFGDEAGTAFSVIAG